MEDSSEGRRYEILAETIRLQTEVVRDTMSTNSRAVERVVQKMEDLDSRLIHIEASKQDASIVTLTEALAGANARIDSLESTRDKVDGAKAFWEFARNTTPYVVVMLFLAYLYFNMFAARLPPMPATSPVLPEATPHLAPG